MKLPDLEIGRVYDRIEVKHYVIKDSDRNLDDFQQAEFCWEPTYDTERMFSLVGVPGFPRKPMTVEYQLLPIAVLEDEIKKLASLFASHDDHVMRIRRIEALLEGGAAAFPIFVDLKHEKSRIREGMHRAVVFLQRGEELIPVFHML